MNYDILTNRKGVIIMKSFEIDKNKLNKYVGNKIKEFRKKKGLTQKELGELIGVKYNTISSYENGTNSLDQNVLYKLSKALDCKMDDFFPSGEIDVSDELERALMMTKNLQTDDILFLKELIEKVLSLQGDERRKFVESLRFMVEYHDKMNQ